MWEVTGNGLEKPSYIYGTMHISGKMVFHLGEPFYDAIKNVDVLALELEPEAWLQAIFDDKANAMWSSRANEMGEFGLNWNNSDLPSLDKYYQFNFDLQKKLRGALMYNPELLNYLLYRFGSFGYGADYEEDTWLDMYLYQTGKKLGKRTIGLETYAQSDAFYKKAVAESRNSKDRKYYDEEDREELAKVGALMETAYRTQDLDLIDSLNKKTTAPAFDKYILVERNKVFVHCMDSVMRSGQSLFSGMGCAHLPGDSGVIEMLRKMGYVVKAFNKGERNVKSRDKIDASIFKRDYIGFTSKDQLIRGMAPHTMYDLFQMDEAAAMISLDIPNAASFMIYRLKSYAGLQKKSGDQIMASIDSILYEVVAGDIIEQKRIERNGFQGFDIYNKNRRGDVHRKQIFIVGEEVIVFSLMSSGQKVLKGYGDEFFNTIQFVPQTVRMDEWWTSQDGTLRLRLPGQVHFYPRDLERFEDPDFAVSSMDTRGNYFFVQRHTVPDPEFFDEDVYETNRLITAFADDNSLKEKGRKVQSINGRTATVVDFEMNQRSGQAMGLVQGLNYYVFTAFTADAKEAETFFTNVIFQADRHVNYYPYRDTNYHYTVELPYEFKPDVDMEEYAYYYASDDDEPRNPFESMEGEGYFAPPGLPDVVKVEFRRAHAFSDPDSLEYIQGWTDKLVEKDGFRLDHYEIKSTPTGVVASFVISDTACARVQLSKKILHYKSLYTLTALYDSISGPGEFITHFFQTFTPLDSTYDVRHFENRDQMFIDSLQNGTSATRGHVAELFGEVDLSQEVIPQVRDMLMKMPQLSDEDDQIALKRLLIESLNEDTSAVNMKFIREQFYANADSSKTQINLLRELLEMKNKPAFRLYKELLLNEPPVTGDGNGTFDLLYDSLELAVDLLPELFSLVTLDEYEISTYRLVSALLDSGLVQHKVYEKQLSFMLLDAKNELKRLNSKKSLEYFSFNRITTYLRLLLPYASRPEVASIFDKSARLKSQDWLLEYLKFQLENEQTPADSLVRRVLTKKELVTELYGIMYENKATAYWPEQWANRDSLVMNYVAMRFNNRYNKKVGVDTSYIFNKELRTIKGKSFEVYYIKFKLKEASSWLGMIIAFDQSDPMNLWPNLIESSDNIVIDADEDDAKEFAKGMRTLEEMNRRSWRWKNSYNQYLY